jgi:hypothetical protein
VPGKVNLDSTDDEFAANREAHCRCCCSRGWASTRRLPGTRLRLNDARTTGRPAPDTPGSRGHGSRGSGSRPSPAP